MRRHGPHKAHLCARCRRRAGTSTSCRWKLVLTPTCTRPDGRVCCDGRTLFFCTARCLHETKERLLAALGIT